MTGQIYALVARDEPLQVRYVGQTIYPLATRLRGHLKERGFCRVDQRKSDWINEVYARSSVVDIVPLGSPVPRTELNRAEQRWIRFWLPHCELLNLQVR